MTNTGFVTDIKDNKAKVRFIRESACGGNCSSCGGCKSKPIEKWIDNSLNVKKGDKIEVKTDSSKILSLAFYTYIMPIIIFLVSYGIMNAFKGEIISVLFGILMLVAFFLIIRKCTKNTEVKLEMIKKVD